MGGSSKDSGSSGGNDGGNNDKPAKKATPKKKVNNGTSKYFKKTSTPKAKKKKASPKGGQPHANTVSKPKAVTPKAVTPKSGGHPGAVATPKVVKKPATVTKSKAVTTPLASPKITTTPIPNEPVKKATTSSTAIKPGTSAPPAAIAPKVEPKPVPVAPKPEPKPVSTEPVNHPASKVKAELPKPAPAPVAKPIEKKAPVVASQPPANHPSNKINATLDKPVIPKPSLLAKEPAPTPVAKDADIPPQLRKPDPVVKDADLPPSLRNPVKPAPVTAPKAIVKPTERINLSKDNKTVAEEPKYDQKYWADKLAKGKADGNENIQDDLKKEMDSIGKKKAYSGDKVVTADMKRRAADDLKRVTGSMAVLDKSGDPEMTAAKKADLTKAGILVGGVTKTEKKSGLLGEKLDTTYDYKGGPSIVTKATDPTIGGVRFGEKTSTTFVDGTEVATKTGHDPLGYDAKVTRPDIAGNIDDTQPIDPTKAAENIKSIDEQIKNETDPVKLKALHKRRLMLMRMNNTNTKFAGLLDDADTKRSNLMSIG